MRQQLCLQNIPYCVEDYQKSDPIELVLKTIRSKKYMTEKQIEKVYADVKEQVAAAVKFAEESPLPEPEDMYQDVYQQEDYPFIMD